VHSKACTPFIIFALLTNAHFPTYSVIRILNGRCYSCFVVCDRMISIRKFSVSYFMVLLLLTFSLLVLPFVFSGYVMDILYFITRIPLVMLFAIPITLLYFLCAYCRNPPSDGWIIEDSSSRKEPSTS